MLRKAILLLCPVLLILWGCDWALYKAFHGDKTGPAPPQIDEAWASDIIRPGDVWKIYLKATHFDGEMKAFVSTMVQSGKRGSPVFTAVPAQYRKALNGYLALNTAMISPQSGDMLLLVKIQDARGNFSDEASFPLTVHPDSSQFPAPLNFFKENNLGPIPAGIAPGTSSGK